MCHFDSWLRWSDRFPENVTEMRGIARDIDAYTLKYFSR